MFSGMERASELLSKHKNDCVYIVSHIDADGLSSAAIVSRALERKGVEHKISCVKLDRLPQVEPGELTIFSDLGSGQLHNLASFKDSDFIVLDHHPPSSALFPGLAHVNPMIDGFDGTSEISGSGVSYFFARELDKKNVDLSPVAIVGACGDMQDAGKLKGLNRIILDESAEAGLISYEDDLMVFGRGSRPVHKALQYFSDPYVPGISSESGVLAFLASLGIEPKEGEWVTISDLTREQKKKIASEMVLRALPYVPRELARFVPHMVIGESYTLLGEERRTPLRDAKEFVTCLNACGRNGRYDIGVRIAKGERGNLLPEMLDILREHREKLKSALDMLAKRKPEMRKHVQVFDGEGVDDSLVGTVASMLLSQSSFEPYKPIVGYTGINEKRYKISARCSRLLTFGNLHLGHAMRIAAGSVGGEGGGHAPACGAYIDKDTLEDFLHSFEGEIERQKNQ